ncbi:MAG: ParB/RepB/Spo0J family partition protein [Acidimicrobiales bacterium]
MPEPTTIVLIPVDALEPDPNNIRKSVGDITELARSIAAVGVIEPCLVKPIEGDPCRFRLVAGHRRHAAAVEAGVAELPCLVREFSEAEVVETQLVENLQRSGLSVLEEAGAYLRLCGLGYSARRLAKRVGRPERHVRERLALLELPESAQAAVEEGTVTLADARVLVVVKDHPDIIEAVVAARPTDVGWAVKQQLRRAAAEEQRAELVGELEAAGVRVVGDEGRRPTSYVVLGDLGVDEPAHGGEPCHAVVITDRHDGPQAIAVCTERRRHTKAGASEIKPPRRDDDPRAAERERARERRRVAAARGEFVADRLARRLPKGPAGAFVIRTLVDRANANDAARAAELLGVDPVPGRYGPAVAPALRALADRSDADALRVAVAVATAMAESRIAAQSDLPDVGRDYLEFLGDLGHGLDGFEHDALAEHERRRTTDDDRVATGDAA